MSYLKKKKKQSAQINAGPIHTYLLLNHKFANENEILYHELVFFKKYMIRLSENLPRLSGLLQMEKAAIHSFYNHPQYSSQPAVFLQEHF